MGNQPGRDHETNNALVTITQAKINVEVARIGTVRVFEDLRKKTKEAGKLGNMATVKANSQQLERIHKTKERLQLEANSLCSMEQDIILQRTTNSTLRAMDSVTNVSNIVSSMKSLANLEKRTDMYADARDRLREHGDIMENALSAGEAAPGNTASDFEQQILDEIAMEENSEMPQVITKPIKSSRNESNKNHEQVDFGKNVN